MQLLKSIGFIFLGIIILFSLGSCSASKNTNDSKKVKNKHFEIEYPKSWKRFGVHGYFYLRPKTYDGNLVNVELNNISLINKTISISTQESYIDVIVDRAQQLSSYVKKRNFNIVKLPETSLFTYRVDYYLKYKKYEGVFRCQEYFYATENGLKYISVQFEKELFDMYKKDIYFIVNNFKIRDL